MQLKIGRPPSGVTPKTCLWLLQSQAYRDVLDRPTLIPD